MWVLLLSAALAAAPDPLGDALDAWVASRSARVDACRKPGENGSFEVQLHLEEGRVDRATVLRIDAPLAEERVCYAQALTGALPSGAPGGIVEGRYLIGVRADGVSVGPRMSPVKLPSLEREQVEARVSRRQDAIDACVAAGRERKPSLSGDMVALLGVDPKGRVVHAEVAWSRLGHPATERCLLDVLETVRFPRHGGEGVLVVRYPVRVES
jgi:hypothetical protein